MQQIMEKKKYKRIFVCLFLSLQFLPFDTNHFSFQRERIQMFLKKQEKRNTWTWQREVLVNVLSLCRRNCLCPLKETEDAGRAQLCAISK